VAKFLHNRSERRCRLGVVYGRLFRGHHVQDCTGRRLHERIEELRIGLAGASVSANAQRKEGK
jgi:hypothetical protein